MTRFLLFLGGSLFSWSASADYLAPSCGNCCAPSRGPQIVTCVDSVAGAYCANDAGTGAVADGLCTLVDLDGGFDGGPEGSLTDAGCNASTPGCSLVCVTQPYSSRLPRDLARGLGPWALAAVFGVLVRKRRRWGERAKAFPLQGAGRQNGSADNG